MPGRLWPAGSNQGQGAQLSSSAFNAPSVAVAMERIEKSFGENRVLIDVNFVVNAGETHALLGENGAGKSTLMKVLIGVYAADGGRIVLGDEDVTALSV